MRPRTALVACVLAALGCGGGGRQQATDGWTVLVYMMADNTLESFAIGNLDEMAAVGSGQGLNLVVQIDRAGRYSSAPIGSIPAPTSSHALRLLVGKNAFTLLGDLGDIDSGAPAALADFIAWGVRAYPARHYALVLWDHGGAWLGGYGEDESHHGSGLSIPELSQAIASGLEQAGVARLGLVGLDACLMGTYEVAKGLEGTAEYLLASEETEPGTGWDYRALAIVQQDAGAEPLTVGKRIADAYRASAPDEEALTLSLVDLGNLAGLDAAIDAMAQVAPTIPVDAVVPVGRTRAQALEFGYLPMGLARFNQVDLGDFWSGAAEAVPAWAAIGQQVAAGLAGAVVYQVRGVATANAGGLSVYFPSDAEDYADQDPTRRYASLAGTASWRAFLDAYLASASTVGTPSFTTALASVVQPGTDWLVTGQLAPGAAAAVTTSTLYYGSHLPAAGPQPERFELYGEHAAACDLERATGTWSGSVLQLVQGATATRGYVSRRPIGTGYVEATIPLAYFTDALTTCEDARTAMLQLILSGDAIVNSTYFVLEAGTTSQLQPAAGSRLETMRVFMDGALATFECSGEPLDAASGVQPEFVAAALPQGSGAQFYARLEIQNPAGKGDVAEAFWIP